MIKHELILQAQDGQNWNELERFPTSSRYLLTKKQRNALNELKYAYESENVKTRIIKRREIVK